MRNMTDVTAKDIHLWLRLCDDCKYVNEPRESSHLQGGLATERVWSISELANNVQWGVHKVEIEAPPRFTQVTLGTQYRCSDCELERDFHLLIINLGRIGFPSMPAPIPKAPQRGSLSLNPH
jgi:hypothetical protein